MQKHPREDATFSTLQDIVVQVEKDCGVSEETMPTVCLSLTPTWPEQTHADVSYKSLLQTDMLLPCQLLKPLYIILINFVFEALAEHIERKTKNLYFLHFLMNIWARDSKTSPFGTKFKNFKNFCTSGSTRKMTKKLF